MGKAYIDVASTISDAHVTVVERVLKDHSGMSCWDLRYLSP
jgi:hypothetical protein